jgi:polyisoprenoid-binding protein YceI
MNRLKLGIGATAVLIASAFTVIQSTNWKLKEEAYSVTFKGGKVEGVIKGLKTSITFDEAKPENSKIIATLDVNTINTGNGMMNKHAKSEDGLDAKKFPSINFESLSVTGKNGKYSANGKLTIKGVTKEINLPFTFENKGLESLFKGKFNIKPKDFNITRGGTPEALEIEITAPVTK